jgi:virulence-associated protein VapD
VVSPGNVDKKAYMEEHGRTAFKDIRRFIERIGHETIYKD